MFCPACNTQETKVLETRTQQTGELRRRRECLICKSRFTTLESVVMSYPYVIKRDGAREQFSPDKLKRGLQLACMKRPVAQSDIEKIVSDITQATLQKNEKEIPSLAIGQWVMHALHKLDHVAYIRFASVYKDFKDVEEFVQSLRKDEKTTHNNEL